MTHHFRGGKGFFVAGDITLQGDGIFIIKKLTITICGLMLTSRANFPSIFIDYSLNLMTMFLPTPYWELRMPTLFIVDKKNISSEFPKLVWILLTSHFSMDNISAKAKLCG